MFYIQDKHGFYVNKSFNKYSLALEYANKIGGEVITDNWCDNPSQYIGCFIINLN